MKYINSIFQPLKVINWKTMLILILVQALLVLTIWQINGKSVTPPPPGAQVEKISFIPGPIAIAKEFFGLLGNKDTEMNFWVNFISSLTLTLKGLFYSILLALFISYLALIPFFRPMANMITKFRYLTISGLYFVFILYSAEGSLKINLLLFGIIPFFTTSLMAIFDSINVQEFELCKTLRMNNWKTLWEVVIVGRIDQVFEVMRQNFAIAWVMISTVEGLVISEGGIGAMINKYHKYHEHEKVYALLLVILLVGILFDFLLGQMRQWLFPYTKLQVLK